MGGTPKLAIQKLPIAAVERRRRKRQGEREAGAMTTGGHSINDKGPNYGLSVTGFAHLTISERKQCF